MKKAYPIVVLFILCLSAFGQQPSATPEASPTQENEVVKITTKLVQLDMIVVDKDGKQVRGLKADDFEVLQDGKPQKVTNFSYVNTEARQSATQIISTDKNAPAPPGKVTPANVGRIITFVVDDGNCAVSNIGMRAAREGLEKFIREQMQWNDLVAIYRTRAGSSLIQQFTNDKIRLLGAAGKIKWMPPPGCGANDGSFFPAAKSNTYVKQSPVGTTINTVETPAEKKGREHAEDRVSNDRIVGMLGLMKYVVQGMRRVSGRKIVFLLSDGLPLRERGGGFLAAKDVLRDLTDLANRASVVINTIDVRGVFEARMSEARDEVYTQDDPLSSDSTGNERADAAFASRDGLEFLADETGGKFSKDSNFIDYPIKQSLAIETGFYLIAYEPSDETFKSKKFNKIEVKAKNADLKVISRAGFFGFVDESQPKGKTEDSDLYQALLAPLPQSGIGLLMTAYFVNTPDAGSAVRVLLRIDGNDVTFIDDKGGTKKAALDVAVAMLDEKGKVVHQFTQVPTLNEVPAAGMPTVHKNGLVYSTDVPVKKAGTYDLRLAVKDRTSKQIGTSTLAVDIPDLSKKDIFVSGLIVAQTDKAGKFAIPVAAAEDKSVSLPVNSAVPAIRRFRRNLILAYAYTIYNAKLDPATGEPKFSVETKLYHNGQLVIDGKPQSAKLEKQTDWTRINDYGYLQLKPLMAPGDYNLQIIITDLLAKEKNTVTSQSVDFEVAE